MPEINAAAFTVTVDNEQEIRAWLSEMTRATDLMEDAFEELLRLTRERPLIALSINRIAYSDGEAR